MHHHSFFSISAFACQNFSGVKRSVYYILTKGLIFIVLIVYHCFDLLTFMHEVDITILLIF